MRSCNNPFKTVKNYDKIKAFYWILVKKDSDYISNGYDWRWSKSKPMSLLKEYEWRNPTMEEYLDRHFKSKKLYNFLRNCELNS